VHLNHCANPTPACIAYTAAAEGAVAKTEGQPTVEVQTGKDTQPDEDALPSKRQRILPSVATRKSGRPAGSSQQGKVLAGQASQASQPPQQDTPADADHAQPGSTPSLPGVSFSSQQQPAQKQPSAQRAPPRKSAKRSVSAATANEAAPGGDADMPPSAPGPQADPVASEPAPAEQPSKHPKKQAHPTQEQAAGSAGAKEVPQPSGSSARSSRKQQSQAQKQPDVKATAGGAHAEPSVAQPTASVAHTVQDQGPPAASSAGQAVEANDTHVQDSTQQDKVSASIAGKHL
jgi:hypothetical protein